MIEALPIPDELPVTKATFFGLLSPQPMFLSRFSKESHIIKVFCQRWVNLLCQKRSSRVWGWTYVLQVLVFAKTNFLYLPRLRFYNLHTYIYFYHFPCQSTHDYVTTRVQQQPCTAQRKWKRCNQPSSVLFRASSSKPLSVRLVVLFTLRLWSGSIMVYPQDWQFQLFLP